MEAMGQDVQVLAEGLSAGLALNLNVDTEELTALYVETYEAAVVEVTVTLEDGVVRSTETASDLSLIYLNLAERWEDVAGPLGGPAPDFDGARLTMATYTSFDFDPTIDIIVPEGDFEDRTDALIDLLAG